MIDLLLPDDGPPSTISFARSAEDEQLTQGKLTRHFKNESTMMASFELSFPYDASWRTRSLYQDTFMEMSKLLSPSTRGNCDAPKNLILGREGLSQLDRCAGYHERRTTGRIFPPFVVNCHTIRVRTSRLEHFCITSLKFRHIA